MAPKLLAISSELPWPLNTGGHLRTFHVLKALSTAFDVRLVVPMPAKNREGIDALSTHSIRVVPVAVGPRTKRGEAKRLLSARLHGEAYALYRRHARGEVFNAWQDELRRDRPDVVHLDHLDSFLFHGAAANANVPAVLDLHNVYSLILQRMADESKGIAKRLFLRGEAKRLAKTERRACRSGAAILAVSDGEAQHFRSLGATDVTVVPNGVDCAAFASLPTGRLLSPSPLEGEGRPVSGRGEGSGFVDPPHPQPLSRQGRGESKAPSILYLGTLSWGPNASAAIHLAEQIFPQVRQRHPNARLVLVGKDPSPEVRAMANRPGVSVAGSVPSIQPYLAEASLLAVPLDSGGGTRLKILEAFAAGLPVVSTAVGAEGIDARPGREIVIAERSAMADAICGLLDSPESGAELAANARRLARGKYDWLEIGRVCVEVAMRRLRESGEKFEKPRALAQPR